MADIRLFLRYCRQIPPYVPRLFAAMLGAQLAGYYLTRPLLPYLTPRILTGPLDARIPFCPPWITVYYLSYVFWIGTGLWILLEDRDHAYRFSTAYILAMLLSGAVFLLFPGTMIRPEVTGTGLFDRWMRFLYRVDAPVNLCPSMHVLISYLCWRGTASCRRIPSWYRTFSFFCFAAISCSVLLVKQHALVDIPAGIITGELSLQTARIFRLERICYGIGRRLKRG